MFQSIDQEQENSLAARRFIMKLEQTTTDELSLCHRYSDMLKRIWQRRGNSYHSTESDGTRELDGTASAQKSTWTIGNVNAIPSVECTEPYTSWSSDQCHNTNGFPVGQDQTHPEWTHGAEGIRPHPGTIQQENEGVLPPDVEEYFFRPFFPGFISVDISSDFGAGLPLQ